MSTILKLLGDTAKLLEGICSPGFGTPGYNTQVSLNITAKNFLILVFLLHNVNILINVMKFMPYVFQIVVNL